MQDLKKNKRRINQEDLQHEFREDLQDDLGRGCKQKGCNCNQEHKCNCECKPCGECKPCKVEYDECVDNKCGDDCNPVSPAKYSNAVPYAIEVNRIFDSIKFQLFTEASGPNGNELFFDYDVSSVNGPVPRSGVVNVNIQKVCMNYTDVVITPGCTTLEDHTVRELRQPKKQPCDQNLCPNFEDNSGGEFCRTSFEYNVCGNKSATFSAQGMNSPQSRGERSAYKQKGLKVEVNNLVLELRGCCGSTEVTVLAYPAVMDMSGNLQPVDTVVFNYNTLSAPMYVPANGKSFTLRQDFQTALTVDCIGKTLLKLVDESCCECYYDFCIPNGIDLMLCLEEVVSALVNEQIVVMASPNSVDPRLVDNFSKVCDFGNSSRNNRD